MTPTHAASGDNILIASGHPQYPPFMWEENGQIVGAGAKLVKAIFDELGIKTKIISEGPWNRVQESARSGKIDVIVAAYLNEDRQSYMEYSVPYADDYVAAFVIKGKEFRFDQWSDLIGKRGGTVRGDSYGEEFDAFMDTKLNIHRVTALEQSFAMMEQGRLDYTIFGLYPGLVEAEKTGFGNKIIALKRPITSEKFYVTISHRSPFRKHMKDVNAIILRLKREGTIDAWIEEAMSYYKAKNLSGKR